MKKPVIILMLLLIAFAILNSPLLCDASQKDWNKYQASITHSSNSQKIDFQPINASSTQANQSMNVFIGILAVLFIGLIVVGIIIAIALLISSAIDIGKQLYNLGKIKLILPYVKEYIILFVIAWIGLYIISLLGFLNYTTTSILFGKRYVSSWTADFTLPAILLPIVFMLIKYYVQLYLKRW